MNQSPSNSPSTSPSSRGIPRIIRRIVPIILLGGVLYTAYYYFGTKDHAPGPEGPKPAEPVPLDVEVITTKKENVDFNPRFLGQTEASRVVEIRARVAGHITERTFQEGGKVTKHQELFKIDSRPMVVELAQATARLESYKAILSRTTLNLRRIEQLSAVDATTLEALEQSQAEQQVAAANQALGEAEVEAAKLQLAYTTIDSPVDGQIGQVLKDVGNYISAAGSEPLVTILQTNPMYVRFPITEKEMLRFRKQIASGEILVPAPNDQKLEITLADGSTYPQHGTIDFQDIKIDQQTGTILVRGKVENKDGNLVPGQFIHTTLLDAIKVNVIRIPQAAVMQSPVGASVYVVNANNILESRPVVLGDWSEDGYWIIDEGLQEGENIATERLMMLRPGAAVKPHFPPEKSPTPEATTPSEQR